MNAFESLAIIPTLALIIALGLHLWTIVPRFNRPRRAFGIAAVLVSVALGYRFAIIRMFQ
jgi:hypothetical protein